MASIRNFVNVVLGVQGAEKVVAGTEQVTKSQTRLGNASTNTARSFSAQSRGLGGVVGVYAASAATIFALTAAFEALNKAARAEQTIQSTKILAATIGESGDMVIAKIKEITNAQLSAAEAAQAVNLALSAGLDLKQIEGLIGGATRASKVLGRDLTDSIQRISRGVVKLEPELLDELGVFVRIDDAVESYAQKLGVAASSLTEFQRRTAFATKVTEQLEQKFGLVSVSTGTAQEAFQKFSATFSELVQNTGSLIANVLTPVLNFFGQNTGNILVALGAVGGLVFSRLIGDITRFDQFLLKSMNDRNTKAIAANKILTDSTNQATEAIAKSQKILPVGRGETALKQQVQGIFASVAAGTINLDNLDKDLPKLEKYIKLAQDDLEVRTKRATEQGKDLARYDRERTILQNQIVTYEHLKTAKDEAAKSASFYDKALNKLSSTGRTLIGVFNVLAIGLGVIGTIFGVLQLVTSLFGIDIIGGIAEWWTTLTKGSKEVRQGIEGIAVSAINATPKLKELFSNKEIDKLKEQMESLIRTSKTLEEQSTNFDISGWRRFFPLLSPKVTVQPPPQNLEIPIESLTILENLQKKWSDLNIDIKNGKLSITDFAQGLEGLKQASLIKITNDFNKSAKSAKDLAIYMLGLKTILKDIGLSSFIGQLSAETGISTDKIRDSLDELGIKVKNNNVYWGAFNLSLKATELDLNKLDPAIKSAFVSQTRFATNLKEINDILKSGAANTVALGSRLVGLENDYSRLNKLLPEFEAKLTDIHGIQLPFANVLLQPIINLIKEYGDNLEIVKKRYDELQVAEQTLIAINKVYGKELTNATQAYYRGIVNAQGQLATSEDEIQKNRLEALGDIINTGTIAKNELNKLSRSGLKSDEASKYALQVKSAAIAINAMVGSAVEFAQEQKKINDELDKRLSLLVSETRLLQQQNELVAIRANIELQQAQFSLTNIGTENTIKLEQVKLQLMQAQATAAQAGINAAKERLSAEQDLLNSIRNRVKAESDLKIAQLERQNAAALFPLTERKAEVTAFPNLYGEKARRDVEREIIALEYSNAMKILEERKNQANREYEQTLKELSLKEKMIKLEAASKGADIQSRLKILEQEENIRKQEVAFELQKLEQQKLVLLKQKEQTELERQQAIAKVNAAKEASLIEVRAIGERSKLLAQEARVYDTLISNNIDFVNQFTKAVLAWAKINDKLTEVGNLQLIRDEDKQKATNLFKDVINSAGVAEIRYGQITDSISLNSKLTIDGLNTEYAAKQRVLSYTITGLEEQKRRIESEQLAYAEIYEQKKKTIEAEAGGNADLLEQKLESLNNERKMEEDKHKTVLENIRAEEDAEKRKAASALAALAREEAFWKNFGEKVSSAIENNLNRSLEELFTAISEGTLTMKNFAEGVMNLFRNLLKDITTEFFKMWIKESIWEPVKGWFGTLFNTSSGVNTNTASAQTIVNAINKTVPASAQMTVDNLKDQTTKLTDVFGKLTYVYITGSVPLQVSVVNQPPGVTSANTSPSVLANTPAAPTEPWSVPDSSMATEWTDDWNRSIANASSELTTATSSVTDSLGGFGSIIGLVGKGFTGLIGIVGNVGNGLVNMLTSLGSGLFSLFSQIGGGIGGGIGGLFSGIFGLFGGGGSAAINVDPVTGLMGAFVEGGPVHRMAGGGPQLRDRIPTLLEPGEFVIRKYAADSIGMNNLRTMNSTGSNNGQQQKIKVELENKGSPKEAEQGQTQFDGETAVVKIILKDLNSNGPIRRTIRGTT